MKRGSRQLGRMCKSLEKTLKKTFGLSGNFKKMFQHFGLPDDLDCVCKELTTANSSEPKTIPTMYVIIATGV